MPSVVECNGKKYIVVGNIKLKNSQILIAINNNDIICADSSTIKKTNNEYVEPTNGEIIFATYLKNKIQENFNNGRIAKYSEINKECNSINEYLAQNTKALDNLYNLSDESIKNNMNSLMSYFDNIMRGYFQEDNKNLDSFPDYDEGAVTTVLSSVQSENFDLDTFVEKYFNDFNLEQINLLLNNFKLNENQINRLNARKNEIDINTNNSNSKSSLGKRKNFALPGIKENKEAAFIDTLLLSFTVGIFCGIYLMYFLLTIMS